MSDKSNFAVGATANQSGGKDTGSLQDALRQAITVMRSNASVFGAFVVIAALFLAQRYAGAWITDSATIDEADIVSAEAVALDPDAVESAGCDPWILSFSDEFDGDGVDDKRWLPYDSPDRDGFGVRQPEAITVEDGNLVITGRRVDDQIVSGAMASNHQQLYGRFEARVRTDADPSETMSGVVTTWPAGNEHPDEGEINFYETLNHSGREPFYSYVHYPDRSQAEIVHDASAEEWHELAMEWTPEAITVYRDGDRIGSVTEPEAIPDHPHVVMLQLDAKSDDLGDNTVQMFVDWVRLYQRNEPLPADC